KHTPPFFRGTKSTIGSARIKSVGKNLFDKNNIIQNKYVGTNGKIYDSEDGRFVSDWIPITPNVEYRIHGRTFGRSAQRIGFYANKNLDSVIDVITEETTTFTVPANTKYLLLTGY